VGGLNIAVKSHKAERSIDRQTNRGRLIELSRSIPKLLLLEWSSLWSLGGLFSLGLWKGLELSSWL
jgi:hypothetical protein